MRSSSRVVRACVGAIAVVWLVTTSLALSLGPRMATPTGGGSTGSSSIPTKAILKP